MSAAVHLRAPDGTPYDSAHPIPMTVIGDSSNPQTPVAVTGAPVAISAATDTPAPFAEQVRLTVIQNNTPEDIRVEFDAPAHAGSTVIRSGQPLTWPFPVTAVHYFTAGARTVNGTAANGIMQKGWK